MARLALGVLMASIVMAGCGQNQSGPRLRAGKNAPAVVAPHSNPQSQPQSPQTPVIPNPVVPQQPAHQFNVFNPQFPLDSNGRVSPQVLAQVFPIHINDQSSVAVLHDGAARYAMRCRLIDEARISIKMQSFILSGDEAGYAIADKLIAAHRRGVNVKIIVDPVVNGTLDDHKMFFYLQRNNIKVLGYEFLYENFTASIGLPRPFGDFVMDANMRTHEKYLITDAEDINLGRAIIGGANVANDYFDVEHEKPFNKWRDQDVIVHGPIVRDMAQAFDRNEIEFIQEKINKNVQDMDQLIQLINLPFGGSNSGMKNPRTVIVKRLAAHEKSEVKLNWQTSTIRFMQSRPKYGENFIAPIYLDMIEQSKVSVDIVNAYFIPDQNLANVIVRAVSRGVKVRIVTNHVKAQEFEGLGHVSRASYKSLLDANVFAANGGSLEIYEWGGDAVLKNGEGHQHAKYATFDHKGAIVGSYNLDPRSQFLDSESIVALDHQGVAADLEAITNSYVDPKYSVKVTVADANTYADPNGSNWKLSKQLWFMFAAYL